MKRVWVAGSIVVAGVLSAGSFRSSALDTPQTSTTAAGPWQAGRCYRVFPENRDQLYIFKVVEASAGPWVRVQADPAAPRVPGAQPQAPLWLNTSAAFAVQEWNCSD